MKKKKRTPWPRWAKVTRNLLLALLFGFLVWGQFGKPLPYEAALRRMERQYLVPKPEHRAAVSRGVWGEQNWLDWTQGAAFVSTPTRYRIFYHPFGQPFPLEDGPALIAFPWPGAFIREGGHLETCALYAALQPPEDSASAQLVLHNDAGTFTAGGERQDEIFVFAANPGRDAEGRMSMNNSWFDLEEFHYELTFYDEAGNVIGEVSG